MATYKDLHNINVRYMECPYDRNHRIPVNRMPQHIVNCQRKSGKQLVMCPFNGCHRMTSDRIAEHVIKCKDQSAILFEQVMTSNSKEDNKSIAEPKPDCEEIWD